MPPVPENKRHIDAYFRSQAWDRAIAELASRQHGVVAWWQLRPLGVTRNAIRRRRENGRLHPVHRGVYAVGHRAVTQRGRWMAAVLACGPGAVLSHRSAAALWGIRDGGAIEVTAPREHKRPRIRTYVATLPPDERDVVDGIPVTTVARTLLDLAGVLPERQVTRAVHQAEYLRLTDTVSLDALIARYPERQQIASMQRTTAPRLLRSDLEHDFLAFADEHGLPRPATNISVEGYE